MLGSSLRRCLKKAVTVMMAAVVSFVAVARGEVLCLCNEDPDDCGHACHTCGAPAQDGLSGGDDCLHLDVASVELSLPGEDVRIPFVDAMPDLPPVVGAVTVSAAEVPPLATSPPPRVSTFCACSIRLFPRS